MKNDTCSEGL